MSSFIDDSCNCNCNSNSNSNSNCNISDGVANNANHNLCHRQEVDEELLREFFFFQERLKHLAELAGNSREAMTLLIFEMTHIKRPLLQRRYVVQAAVEWASEDSGLEERRSIRSAIHCVLKNFAFRPDGSAAIFPSVQGCLELHALLARGVEPLRTHAEERRLFLELAPRLYARPELPEYESELFRWCESFLPREKCEEEEFQKEAAQLVSELLQNWPTRGSVRRQLIYLRHLRKYLRFWDTTGEICQQNFEKLCERLSSCLASRRSTLIQAVLRLCQGQAFAAALGSHSHRVTAFQALLPHFRKLKAKHNLPRVSRFGIRKLQKTWRQLDRKLYLRARRKRVAARKSELQKTKKKKE